MNFVSVSQAQGRIPVTILELHDRINLGNIPELEQAAKDAITAGAHDILIDLSNVPSLTSAGIRALLVIHKMLTTSGMDQGSHLKLVSPTPYVKEVLQVAGLLDYLEVFASLEEALASF
jgi:anti-anti-sigma factor